MVAESECDEGESSFRALHLRKLGFNLLCAACAATVVVLAGIMVFPEKLTLSLSFFPIAFYFLALFYFFKARHVSNRV